MNIESLPRSKIAFVLVALALIPLCCKSVATPISADATQPQRVKCDEKDVALAESPEALRELADRCAEGLKPFAPAINKLNAIPPSPEAKLVLAKKDPQRGQENTTLLMAVNFRPFEAYPTEEDLEKLNRLISMIGKGFRLKELLIESGQDDRERLDQTVNLPRKRLEFVKRFFSAAGLDPESSSFTERPGLSNPRPSGAVDDRATFVEVNIHRSAPAEDRSTQVK